MSESARVDGGDEASQLPKNQAKLGSRLSPSEGHLGDLNRRQVRGATGLDRSSSRGYLKHLLTVSLHCTRSRRSKSPTENGKENNSTQPLSRVPKLPTREMCMA